MRLAHGKRDFAPSLSERHADYPRADKVAFPQLDARLLPGERRVLRIVGNLVVHYLADVNQRVQRAYPGKRAELRHVNNFSGDYLVQFRLVNQDFEFNRIINSPVFGYDFSVADAEYVSHDQKHAYVCVDFPLYLVLKA